MGIQVSFLAISLLYIVFQISINFELIRMEYIPILKTEIK